MRTDNDEDECVVASAIISTRSVQYLVEKRGRNSKCRGGENVPRGDNEVGCRNSNCRDRKNLPRRGTMSNVYRADNVGGIPILEKKEKNIER